MLSCNYCWLPLDETTFSVDAAMKARHSSCSVDDAHVANCKFLFGPKVAKSKHHPGERHDPVRGFFLFVYRTFASGDMTWEDFFLRLPAEGRVFRLYHLLGPLCGKGLMPADKQYPNETMIRFVQGRVVRILLETDDRLPSRLSSTNSH
jgi:hypothetical protein